MKTGRRQIVEVETRNTMKKYILYNHGGSDNRGCEAIVRSTIKLLKQKKESTVLFSLRTEPDYAAGIDALCAIKDEKRPVVKRNILNHEWLRGYVHLKLRNDGRLLEDYYRYLTLGVKRGDVALSIGGDNYCYGGTEAMERRNRFFHKHGAKTVLWACSVEPSVLENSSIAKDLASFDCILARESISYEALKTVNSNVRLVCDPAFLLETTYRPLPPQLEEKNYIGINLSPLVEKNEKTPGIARKNYETLIEYILNQTSFGILLFPHVVCPWDDDRAVLNELLAKYESSGRVVLLDDMCCTDIKGYVARCKYVITARTHASIAAYSSFVPTLVLGYSVKSKGIARDLFGTEENYVVPVQSLTSEVELVKRYLWLEDHEKQIIDQLQSVLPSYTSRILTGAELINQL